MTLQIGALNSGGSGPRKFRRYVSRFLAGIAALGLIAGLGVVASAPAVAANAADFDPGYIISDAQFYDGNAMTAAEIQAFLESKSGVCQNSMCLDIAVVPVPNRPASYSADSGKLACAAITGGNLRVSELIYRTQVACNISAKVILATLQKEQSLVTSTAPTAWQLRAAMGQGCPDTAACDDSFAGLALQIISGARQLSVYKAALPHSSFAFREPGAYAVQYKPNSSCGAPTIYIRNYATLALYNYTPYQPNAAAMANLYGLGDSCSSYGNRNFWVFYSDWFGSPTGIACVTNPTSEIQTHWADLGGAAGALGAPVSPGIVPGPEGATVGHYERGNIYCTPRVGPAAVGGEILGKYIGLGASAGPLGGPTGASVALSAGGVTGQVQYFQRGMIVSSASTGTYAVLNGPIRDAWGARGGSGGALGWPMSDATSSGGVSYQLFQRGAIGAQASGAAAIVEGSIFDYWSTGSHASELGAPTASATAWSAGGVSGTVQHFQRGLVLSSAATGMFSVLNGAVRDAWGARGGAGGVLGWPVGEMQTSADFSTQDFQHGTIVLSSSGAAGVLDGAIRDYWRAGSHSATLGAPTDGRSGLTAGGTTGVVQNFERGMVLSAAATGTFSVLHGPVRVEWGARGGTGGELGWPIGDQVAEPDGSVRQQFQGGTVTIPSAGLSGEIGTYWSSGSNAVKLGKPIGAASTLTAGGVTGTMQTFERGMVLSSPATGTYAVLHGPVRTAWGAQGGTGGALGWPTGDQKAIAGGYSQDFQHGTAYVSASGVGAAISGAIADYWHTAPNATRLGFPSSAPSPLTAGGNSGTLQVFERGMVLSSSGTGTHAVLNGPIRNAWGALGGSGGSLGWPIGGQEPYEGGARQDFEHGAIILLPGGGTTVVSGAIGVYWRTGGNAELLGAPIGSVLAVTAGSTTGSYQVFQRGMVLSASIGTYSVLNGAMRDAWGLRGGTGGSLGWPIGEQESAPDGGVSQRFQGGLVQVGPDGRTLILSGAFYTYWSAGSNAATLGLPVQPVVNWSANAVNGSYQLFAHAIVMSAPELGTFAVLNGPIREAWGAQGGSNGPLGWPVADQRALDGGGAEQQFQGGLLVVAGDGDLVELSGEMFEYWIRDGNRDVLGYPTTESRVWVAGGVTGRVQDFAHGSVLASSTTGVHAVLFGPIRTEWGRQGGTASPLGWPTSDAHPFEGGTRQNFQGGTIIISAAGDVRVE